MSNWPAPCALCGYNGPGFFQPQTHPCAKHATERDALLAEVARLREDLDVVDDDLSLAAKRWQAEAEKALRERDEARAEVERLAHLMREAAREWLPDLGPSIEAEPAISRTLSKSMATVRDASGRLQLWEAK